MIDAFFLMTWSADGVHKITLNEDLKEPWTKRIGQFRYIKILSWLRDEGITRNNLDIHSSSSQYDFICFISLSLRDKLKF